MASELVVPCKWLWSGHSCPLPLTFSRCRLRNPLTSYTVRHTVYVVHYMATGTASPEVFENLKLELRRGCLTLAVLTQLRTERYGYTLRRALADEGLEIDEGTLYPLLRRLETQGLLVSQWREEDKRNKRFYRLSETGIAVLQQLLYEWGRINSSLERILQEV
jgi:PadR family transcriptional regulator, regulatory protein PadR